MYDFHSKIHLAIGDTITTPEPIDNAAWPSECRVLESGA
jgi:hypothetical protein